MQYIYNLPAWPDFYWDKESIFEKLSQVRFQQGRLLGHMNALGFQLQQEATLSALTEEVFKTSEIEGEKLNKEQIRSSIARRLGIDIGALTPADRNVEGIVEIMIDATTDYIEDLTEADIKQMLDNLYASGWKEQHF
jgi:Fic family protein